MGESTELKSSRISIRSTTELDRSELLRIRATDAVYQRWRGGDLSAEFDRDLADDELYQYTISTVGGEVVGLIQYDEEDDPDYRHASLDIYIDPAHHRKGYATEAISLLANYLFDELRHHRLTIDPAANNTGAIACYTAVGFTPVGVLRSYEKQPDGTWADGLLMEMLASDRQR